MAVRRERKERKGETSEGERAIRLAGACLLGLRPSFVSSESQLAQVHRYARVGVGNKLHTLLNTSFRSQARRSVPFHKSSPPSDIRALGIINLELESKLGLEIFYDPDLDARYKKR